MCMNEIMDVVYSNDVRTYICIMSGVWGEGESVQTHVHSIHANL